MKPMPTMPMPTLFVSCFSVAIWGIPSFTWFSIRSLNFHVFQEFFAPENRARLAALRALILPTSLRPDKMGAVAERRRNLRP